MEKIRQICFKVHHDTFMQYKSLMEITCITKTCLYKFDPLKPPFYIVKLGFTGVYIIFLISAQKYVFVGIRQNRLDKAVLTSTHNLCFLSEQKNIDCGYSLEPPRRGGSNEYPQSMFLSRNKKTVIVCI